MEQKIKYQYTYFIYPYIIEPNKYNKYMLKLIRNPKCKLKTFDRIKDFDIYTYFLPNIRDYMFWTFGLSTQKINELQNMESKMQSAILSKYPCTIFEYELEKNIQGKVGEQNGIFFDILKMEVICFNTGICFLTFKTVLNGENNLDDVLNFNYKFRDINSNLSQLREYENIRIQTSTFKDIRDFSSLIKEIAGNSTGAKKINVETERFITYSYVCLDQNCWNESTNNTVLNERFLNYANIANANSKTNSKVKEIEQRYVKFGFTSWSAVVMASDINTDNYTKLPFEYENKYLYHYIFNIYKKIYLKKLIYEFNMSNNFEKIKEQFINFTKFIWIQEITNNELGISIEEKERESLLLEETYLRLKNKYDILYKNYNIERIAKGNKIIAIIVIGIFIVTLMNLFGK